MNRTNTPRPWVTLLTFCALALIGLSAQAQTRPKIAEPGVVQPKTMMYVGNSFFYYNNGISGQVLNIARWADTPNRAAYRSTLIGIGGSGLNWHNIDAYFAPGGVASYSFVGENEIRFNKFDRPFDLVIMMDCSQCPIHPQLGPMFHEWSKKHSDTVRKHKAQPVLFMSWAYEDKPEMTAGLAEQYTIAGNANNALVIPAGLAFANAIAKQPDIRLYVADKRHPSARGTYLAAGDHFRRALRKITRWRSTSRNGRRDDGEIPAGNRLGNRAGVLRPFRAVSSRWKHSELSVECLSAHREKRSHHDASDQTHPAHRRRSHRHRPAPAARRTNARAA